MSTAAEDLEVALKALQTLHAREAHAPEENKDEDAVKLIRETFNRIGKMHLLDETGLDSTQQKPPLGVMSEWMWKEHRIAALSQAITRYAEAGQLHRSREAVARWARELAALTCQPEDEFGYTASANRAKRVAVTQAIAQRNADGTVSVEMPSDVQITQAMSQLRRLST